MCQLTARILARKGNWGRECAGVGQVGGGGVGGACCRKNPHNVLNPVTF